MGVFCDGTWFRLAVVGGLDWWLGDLEPLVPVEDIGNHPLTTTPSIRMTLTVQDCVLSNKAREKQALAKAGIAHFGSRCALLRRSPLSFLRPTV